MMIPECFFRQTLHLATCHRERRHERTICGRDFRFLMMMMNRDQDVVFLLSKQICTATFLPIYLILIVVDNQREEK
jgi:hypothetical protein